MPIFKPKKGPILRWSRGLHLIEAAAITAAGGFLWGETGAAYAGAAAIAGGFGWEVSNKWIPGPHMFGDGWDFLAFVAGAFVGAGIQAVF